LHKSKELLIKSINNHYTYLEKLIKEHYEKIKQKFPVVTGDPTEQLFENMIENYDLKLTSLDGKTPIDSLKHF